MFCLACTEPCAGTVCATCRRSLRPASTLLLPGGLVVVGAFAHSGAAKRLVHALKYRAVTVAAEPFVEAVARLVPASTTMLVPVPRALARRVRYGIDPARILATRLSEHTGIPVIDGLDAPLWWRRHAGSPRTDRVAVHFTPGAPTDPGAVLVDDVVTTGATVRAAAGALSFRPSLVLAATVAYRVNTSTGPAEVA